MDFTNLKKFDPEVMETIELGNKKATGTYRVDRI